MDPYFHICKKSHKKPKSNNAYLIDLNNYNNANSKIFHFCIFEKSILFLIKSLRHNLASSSGCILDSILYYIKVSGVIYLFFFCILWTSPLIYVIVNFSSLNFNWEIKLLHLLFDENKTSFRWLYIMFISNALLSSSLMWWNYNNWKAIMRSHWL
jgi:hypothetical protein